MEERLQKRSECILDVARSLAAMHEGEARALDDFSGMKGQIKPLVNSLRSALYPQVFGKNTPSTEFSGIKISFCLEEAADILGDMLLAAYEDRAKADEIIHAFLNSLPDIKATLETDICAAYEGDPAAKNVEEIMLAYPAFEAISIFRLAHRLYELNVPLIPRMMTEYAHRITGIDIHPGATIGRYFFIDHGTGVVIGETTTIGEHVKLYQGVTLGAKSFELDADGNPVKGRKRHPDIGNYVVIYSGATILGGRTKIGDGCVIGGNVWLTHPVEAGKTVLVAAERAHCVEE